MKGRRGQTKKERKKEIRNKEGKKEMYKLINKNVTFIGPCIVVYSYNKRQRDALFLKFILIKNSACVGQIYCPSSAVSTLYTQQ